MGTVVFYLGALTFLALVLIMFNVPPTRFTDRTQNGIIIGVFGSAFVTAIGFILLAAGC